MSQCVTVLPSKEDAINAHTPLFQIGIDPTRRQAMQHYAGMLPACAATACMPAPLAYPGEDEAIIARHALRVALHVAAVAADRAKNPRVQKLLDLLADGDDWSSRYARSCNDDDLAVVDHCGSELRAVADDIAYSWGV